MNSAVQRVLYSQTQAYLRSCLFLVLIALSLFMCMIATFTAAYFIPLADALEQWKWLGAFILGNLLNLGLWFITATVVVWQRRNGLQTKFQAYQPNFRVQMLGQCFESSITVDNQVITVLLQRGPTLTLAVPLHTGKRATYSNSGLDTPLLKARSQNEIRSLLVMPELVQWRMYRPIWNTYTPREVEDVVSQFSDFLKQLKVQPVGSEVSTKLEQFNFDAIYHRGKITLRVLVVLLGIILIGLICVLPLVLLALLFPS